MRAFLEATAYAVRANLEQAESLLGAQASTISVGGGMTKTRTFAEILAEVLGRDIGVSSTDNVSAYGAYLCAMTGLAEYGSLREAARPDETSLCRLEPSSLEGAIYADGYARWLEAGCELEAIAL